MTPNPNNSVWNLLNELSKKSGITEVIINGPQNVFVEHQGELVKLNSKVEAIDIESFVVDVATFNRKEFDESHPVLDGNLPDGSRINAIHGDFTRGNSAITIRKYLKTIKTFDASPGVFGLESRWVELLKKMIAAKLNIVVSGGTGVGKTTFLNLMLQEIDPMQRIITIEDTRELNFHLPNVIRLESRNRPGVEGNLTMRDLVKNTLRMRPDRIIIGEVRGGEVFDLLQAMNTGHEGSMASLHANSPGEALNRIENLYLLSGYDVPVKAIRYQIGAAVDVIVQLKRTKEGQRVVGQITELAGFEGDRILMQDVGLWKDGKFRFSGIAPKSMARLIEAGLPQDFFVGL